MPRIFLIDDDELLRKSLRKTLVRAGYEVEDAPNVHTGLREYRRQANDLIITDIVMPDIEGLELIRHLRRLDADVKIIAMSGGGVGKADNYLEMARMFGATRTLAKPFTGEEMLALVADVLAGCPDTTV